VDDLFVPNQEIDILAPMTQLDGTATLGIAMIKTNGQILYGSLDATVAQPITVAIHAVYLR